MKVIKIVAAGLVAALCIAPVLATAADLKVGAEVPNFELQQYNSQTPFKLADFKGKQALVLDFSQSACGSCKALMEYLRGFYGKSADYEIVMVNVDAKAGSEKWAANMKTIIEAENIPMRIIMDPKFTLGPQFGVRATPAVVVIDKEGKFVGTLVGFDDSMRDAYKKLIESAK